jgi:hypothetical protein
MRPFWIWRSHANITHQIGARSITPVVQSVGLRWPGGGWLWQYPLAVEVEDKIDGTQRRLPIPDPTRMIVWFLCALALVTLFAAALTMWWSRQRTLKKKAMQKNPGKKYTMQENRKG